MTKLTIGIDPGLSGGIAAIYMASDGSKTVDVWKMPQTEKSLSELVKMLSERVVEYKQFSVWLEQVHAYPTAIKDKSKEHQALIASMKTLSRTTTGNGASAIQASIAKLDNYHHVNRGATSTWTFAQHYGSLRMALVAHGIAFETITAKGWQKLIGFSGTKDHSLNKKQLKGKAVELFPNVNVTNYVADALLIAHACSKIKSQTKLAF